MPQFLDPDGVAGFTKGQLGQQVDRVIVMRGELGVERAFERVDSDSDSVDPRPVSTWCGRVESVFQDVQCVESDSTVRPNGRRDVDQATDGWRRVGQFGHDRLAVRLSTGSDAEWGATEAVCRRYPPRCGSRRASYAQAPAEAKRFASGRADAETVSIVTPVRVRSGRCSLLLLSLIVVAWCSRDRPSGPTERLSQRRR